MKTALILLTYLSIILVSCERDNGQLKQMKNEIIAGDYDSLSMFYYDFSPDWTLVDNEVGCHQYLGMDSINIDQNLNFDIKFRYYLSNDIMCECFTDTIGECFGSLYFERAIETTYKYQIHTDSLDWAIPLDEGVIIDCNLHWSDSDNILLSRLSSISDTGQGYWKWGNVMDTKYLGIRKIETFDTIYGWILMDTKETIAVKEYAFNRKIY